MADDDAVNGIVEAISNLPDLVFKPSKGETAPTEPAVQLDLLQGLLKRDPALFLERYGKHLSVDQLGTFIEFKKWKDDYEVGWHLNSLQSKFQQSKKSKMVVKNRRYTKLQLLIQNGEYFKHENIKSRYPYLYHKYVGQYEDASARKFKADMPLSERLMVNIDEDNMRQQRKSDHQQFSVYGKDDDDSDDDMDEEEAYNAAAVKENIPQKLEEDVVEEEEDDDDAVAEVGVKQEKTETTQATRSNSNTVSSSSEGSNGNGSSGNRSNGNGRKTGPSVSNKEVRFKGDELEADDKGRTDAEKEDNRNLLMDLVYQKFLMGEDVDFDYSEVDNNENLDPENLDRDMESVYFDKDDEGGGDQVNHDTGEYDY